MLTNKCKFIIVLSTLLSSFLWSANSAAIPVSWTITGPGTVSAVDNSTTDWDLNYALNPAGFNTVIWDVSAIATMDGDVTLDWSYTGFHAFFRVTAFLDSTMGDVLVDAGPEDCCTEPSNGFSYNGSYTFVGLTAGDYFGFSMGGSNFDSNNQLTGTLNLVETSVPAPPVLLLLGIGLAGILVTRKKNS